MNIKELMNYEHKQISNYYSKETNSYSFYLKNLTSLKGLSNDFNSMLWL